MRSRMIGWHLIEWNSPTKSFKSLVPAYSSTKATLHNNVDKTWPILICVETFPMNMHFGFFSSTYSSLPASHMSRAFSRCHCGLSFHDLFRSSEFQKVSDFIISPATLSLSHFYDNYDSCRFLRRYVFVRYETTGTDESYCKLNFFFNVPVSFH